MRDLLYLLHQTMTRAQVRERDERGDVPGWVMITVMTAGLVVAITAVASSQLQEMLTSALNSVK